MVLACEQFCFQGVAGLVVTDNAEDDSVNPYAPPISAPAVMKVDDASQSSLNVELLGRPTQVELEACLAAEQRVNVFGFVGLLVFFITPLLVIAAQAFLLSLFLVCVGVCGGVIVVYVVSGVKYRAGVFKNEFPQWDAMDGGRIDSDGIALFDGDSWSMYRWGWFSHAIVANNAISFIPALKSKCPVMIGQNMLVSGVSGNVVEEWETFCKSSVNLLLRTRTGANTDGLADDPSQMRANVELMCNRERLRSVSVESGAVSFSGDVTTRDLERISTGTAELARTSRSRVVILLLLLFGGLIFGGVSDLWLGAAWILLALYCIFILAWNIKARTTRVGATQKRHYFLLGYATDQCLLLDLGVTVASLAWRDMQLIVTTADLIAVKSGRRGQPIVLRPDMFLTEDEWKHVFETAMHHVTPVSA